MASQRFNVSLAPLGAAVLLLLLCCMMCSPVASFSAALSPSTTTGSVRQRGSVWALSSASSPDLSSSSALDAADSDESSSSISRRPQRLSRAALWHQQRRKAMIAKYGKEILNLEQESSQSIGLPLLFLGNVTLLCLALLAGSLPVPAIVGLAIFPGSILSLWQLQILHDCLHGTLLDKQSTSKNKAMWQRRILFWGSLPCVFGYYLYLQYGHLSHHKSVGGADASLLQLFDSSQVDFEDGDVLFVSHRMNLKGPIGPQIPIPSLTRTNGTRERRFRMSISRSGFYFWQTNRPIWNAIMFASSFLFERYMLCWNDVVVAVTGRNLFFPNKPNEFHRQCATYTRCAVALRLALYLLVGWKSLLFLFLSETLWSIPPHPACAMFITNHGSKQDEQDGACQPSSSTYAGSWYSILTLGTNYHCEHHDFPSIPFHLLYKLHQIAPEYYPASLNKDNVFEIMNKTFARPEFYACSNANRLQETSL